MAPVSDNNEPSLEDGRKRAQEAGLSQCMSFVLCDVSDRAQVVKLARGMHLPWNSSVGTSTPVLTVSGNDASPVATSSSVERQTLRPGVDLVFGLHCCGGLSEAALELAISCSASFRVCTCCFCSHPMLATLSQHADDIQANTSSPSDGTTSEPDQQEKRRAQHRKDRELVSRLAVTVGMQGQHRAIRALNAMRLCAAEAAFLSQPDNSDGSPVRKQPRTDNATPVANGSSGGAGGGGRKLKTWQESFPVQYSVQNRVLVGEVVPHD